jgi:hypothetical protein
VLYLVLILLLTGLVLIAVFAIITAVIQGMLYENVQRDLLWRAPAAAGALTAYITLWSLLNYSAAEPGQTVLPYGGLGFTTEEVSKTAVPDFWVVRGSAKVYYKGRDLPGSPRRVVYDDPDGKVWSAPQAKDVDAILVKEGEREVRFKAHYNTEKPEPGKERHVERFVEEGGRRYLDPEAFGKIIVPRSGGAFVRVLLNVLHFAVWFVCLWLLLRFQWPHALGLAAVLWLVMTLVVPFILGCGADAKAPRPRTARIALAHPRTHARL